LRTVIIGFTKTNRIYSPGNILSSNNYKINILANKSMKLNVSTLLSTSASPAYNKRKLTIDEVNLNYCLRDKYLKHKEEHYSKIGIIFFRNEERF
jgi:hypothetical protein